MRRIALGIAALSLAVGLMTAACSSGPPKQAEVPDVDKDTGQDMAPGEGSPAPAGTDAPEAAPEADKMHEKCCAACKGALAKDRSGAAASTIPCADFTADMDVFCIEHFRSKPTMASACP